MSATRVNNREIVVKNEIVVAYRSECTEKLEKFEDVESCSSWKELVNFSILRSCVILK